MVDKLFILFVILLMCVVEYFSNYLFVKQNIHLFYDLNKNIIDKELNKNGK